MTTQEIKNKEQQYIMQTYGRFAVVLDHGKGSYVFDKQGKKYLDFISGIACVPIGHANKDLIKAVVCQVKKLTQVSNLYYTEPQVKLAEKLVKFSGLKKVFFANSGSEANEAAIKLAKKITGKQGFIVCKHAFHGRTHGSLSATWKEDYKKQFLPLVEGFTFVEYNDPEAVASAINKNTAAVMIEPIQGEAGVIVPNDHYLQKVEKICREKKVLLIIDEVQTGNGRTGKYFNYLYSGIKPDIVTTAKGLANGIPIGVCISKHEFGKSEHASTFGGNNIACAAANATIDHIIKNKLMENAVTIGNYLMCELKKLSKVKQVRGKGLMIGVDIKADAKKVCVQCCQEGLLINNASVQTLRFLPPLNTSVKEVDKAIKILKRVLKNANE